jgi:hypothetical protein
MMAELVRERESLTCDVLTAVEKYESMVNASHVRTSNAIPEAKHHYRQVRCLLDEHKQVVNRPFEPKSEL